jgi:hypothetical protein
MHPPLREDDPPAANFVEHKTTGMPLDRGARQPADFAVGDDPVERRILD